MSGEATEFISREQVVSKREQEAIKDAGLIEQEKPLNAERSDEELGSLSYWRTLAETLREKKGEIDFQQRSEEAQHIFDELNDKGQVKRSEVDKFYSGWNKFLVLKANTEAQRQAETAAGMYDDQEIQEEAT